MQLPKLFARFLAQRDGAVAVEFAIIAIPFFLIVLATLQTAITYMAEQELETAVEESSRLILTNQGPNYTQSQFTNAVCAEAVVLFNCSGLMVDVRNYGTGTGFSSAITSAPTLTYDSNGNVTNTWQFSPGVPGSIVVVRVMYQWPIFLKPFGFNLSNLPNGDRLIMATAVFRNEPS